MERLDKLSRAEQSRAEQSRAEQDNSALFGFPNINSKRSHRYAVWERFLCLRM